MKQAHREIIRTFLDDAIHELSIYSGYNGGIVLKITSGDLALTQRVQEYCNRLDDVECNVKHNRNIALYEIFCVVPDDDIYALKNNHRFS